jgi:AcrR family transcriptional regulator
MTQASDGFAPPPVTRESERLEEVAAQLFAAFGYDGTSLSQIAESAGQSVARVVELAGGKRELYLAVTDRLSRDKWGVLTGSVAWAEACRETSAAILHRMADAYLDFCVAHPRSPVLCRHRGLANVGDNGDTEGAHCAPYIQLIIEGLASAVDAEYIGKDVDLELLVWSIIWCTDDFCQGGIPDGGGNFAGGQDAGAVHRFRAHLHQMVGRTMVSSRSPFSRAPFDGTPETAGDGSAS